MAATLELELRREHATEDATVGRLVIPSASLVVFTLEDALRPRGVKIAGQTAIPAGRYRVQLAYSPRFECELPRLLDVPMFRGILIHAGNTTAHTRGCILVGRAVHRVAPPRLIDSKRALADVLEVLEAHRTTDTWITITDPARAGREAA